MAWARRHTNGYECSSAGDKRFSALFAVLPDGRTIEEAYQLDVKGYRAISDNWKDGKGNAPYNGKNRDELWVEYLGLWAVWVAHNNLLFEELKNLSNGKILTDQFATSDINQAHALSVLIERDAFRKKLPFSF